MIEVGRRIVEEKHCPPKVAHMEHMEVFLKWWYPTTIGFPTKNHHFGVFLGVLPFKETPKYGSPEHGSKEIPEIPTNGIRMIFRFHPFKLWGCGSLEYKFKKAGGFKDLGDFYLDPWRYPIQFDGCIRFEWVEETITWNMRLLSTVRCVLWLIFSGDPPDGWNLKRV